MKDELIDEELEIKELDADADEEDDELKKAAAKKNRTRAVIKDILSNSLFLLVVLIVTLLLVKYVGQRTVVVGHSMEHTLSDGDSLIVDKISYRFRDPKRFEVIVFPFEYKEETYYIKRIIGLPGETVRIDENGVIYINGEVLNESYGIETIQDPGTAINEITLGEGQYFVMGDNRNHSSDSRTPSVGLIERKNIIGRAWVRIYPFNKMGGI
ncbi:MAG: signal peptidase I [Lachnospiraceae bacterium]|nr:signal peptidase I [Lachnospiraceae bacterium]